ncbi:hypothetical protein HK101_005670 [Irineochytrium annulatum]|nr:hypothetical protein HK101_005670 [Irineochytrium annulatum]
MRALYESEGVDGYYAAHGTEYRNPHLPVLRSAFAAFVCSPPVRDILHELDPAPAAPSTPPAIKEVKGGDDVVESLWMPNRLRVGASDGASKGPARPPRILRVLDLACGSGEATECLLSAVSLLKAKYIKSAGADGWPVFDQLHAWCCDPYTSSSVLSQGLSHCSGFSFEDIADGALRSVGDGGLRVHMVVCSFALHLVEGSRMGALLAELAACARWLVVVSPTKRPAMDGSGAFGWEEVRGAAMVVERIHFRVFGSLIWEGFDGAEA